MSEASRSRVRHSRGLRTSLSAIATIRLSIKHRVRALAERLLADGIEVILDQYVKGDSPAEGWPRWMDRQIADADSVLMVCTETTGVGWNHGKAGHRARGAVGRQSCLPAYL